MKIILMFLAVLVPQLALSEVTTWSEYAAVYEKKKDKEENEGISYMISGGIAIVGGSIGQGVAKDPFEKAAYSLFQTMGIASLGYGAYQWKIGDEDRLMFETLQKTPMFTDREKLLFLKSFQYQKKERQQRVQVIKAVTHGLIAAFNLYNGSQQSQSGIRSSLYFIGGVNVLACVNYTF